MTIETLAAETAALLARALPNADCYPSGEAPRRAPERLRRPAIAVALQKLEAAPFALGDCLGGGSGAAVCGKRAAATLSLAIWAPTEAACHQAFAAAAQALLFDRAGAEELSCGAAEYQLRQEAFRLSAQAKRTLLLTREESQATAARFTLHAQVDSDSNPEGGTA